MEKNIVISLGGSLIVPDRINTTFLAKFREFIIDFTSKGGKAAIVCGGGKTARQYQEAASKLAGLRDQDIDWIGIHATRLNAQLVKTLFLGIVHEKIIHDPNEKTDFSEKVLIAAGWKPGFSTDYDAVLLAKNLGISTVINLSNIDYVYDKCPKKNPGASPIKRISWAEFRKIISHKWSPGLNAPFDPVAAKEAEKLGIRVAVINGEDTENIKRFVEGGDFKGTLIS